MSTNTPIDEIKTKAMERVAEIRIYHLVQIVEIINLASVRGAFKGPELSHVGAIYDNLASGINKAIEFTKLDLEKTKNTEVKNTAGISEH